ARPNDKIVIDSVRGPIGFLGQVVQRNFYGNGVDEILAVDQVAWNTGTPVTSTFWTFTDHQDSVRDIVSGNAADRGAVVEHRQYDSFGRIVRRTTGPQATAPATAGVGIDFGYAGRPLEARTGLSDNRARWYEPATGRFINEDPSGFRGGDANLFRYGGNDPLNQVDPSGLAAKWASYAGKANVPTGGWGALVQQNAKLPKAASPSVSAIAYASLVRQPPQAAAAAAPMFSMAPPAVMVSTSGGAVYSPVATSRSNTVQASSASPYQSVYRTEVERVTAPLAGAGFANNGWNGGTAGYRAGTSNARGWADAAGNRWNTNAGEISAYGPPPPPPTWRQFGEAVSGIAVAIAGRGTGVRTNVGSVASTQLRVLNRSFTPVESALNKATAFEFYTTQSRFSPAKALQHMRGIDFDRPVTVDAVVPGMRYQQYVGPGGVGRYFSLPGTTPLQSGIDPVQAASRPLMFFESSVRTPALRSYAAPDFLYPQGLVPDSGAGGGLQIFVPHSKAMVPYHK
ncbi:MAG: hypothetical protein RLZZ21_28, partial [Planctomycetota bacterium]